MIDDSYLVHCFVGSLIITLNAKVVSQKEGTWGEGSGILSRVDSSM